MEVPRHWRLKEFRYGLRVEVNPDGKVAANVPPGVRDFVEKREQPEELAWPIIKMLAESDIIRDETI